jgi:hypothetical protein
MIVVRNVFQVKFGRARDAVALMKEGIAIGQKVGMNARVLTDITGPAYTVVLETTHENLGDFEAKSKDVMGSVEWKGWYQKFIPLVESGNREIFSVAEM